jgi:hypothetical protein
MSARGAFLGLPLGSHTVCWGPSCGSPVAGIGGAALLNVAAWVSDGVSCVAGGKWRAGWRSSRRGVRRLPLLRLLVAAAGSRSQAVLSVMALLSWAGLAVACGGLSGSSLATPVVAEGEGLGLL